jgi:hypothetical protein
LVELGVGDGELLGEFDVEGVGDGDALAACIRAALNTWPCPLACALLDEDGLGELDFAVDELVDGLGLLDGFALLDGLVDGDGLDEPLDELVV